MKNIYLLLLVFPLVISCGIGGTDQRPPPPPPTLPPSAEHREFVAEMNAIIEDVSIPLTSDELNEKFFSNGNALSGAKFVLFGENHVDYPTLLLQARAFQTLVSSRDLVLFEGNKAGTQLDCDRHVFNLYAVKKWNATGKSYDPKEKADFSANLYELFERNRAYLNLQKLNLHFATCVFWDDLAAHDIEPELRSSTIRNETMVDTMRTFHYRNYNRIFVRAGLLHLPSGDLDWFKHLFSQQPLLVQQFGFGLTPLDIFNPYFDLDRYYNALDQVTHPAGLDFLSKSTFGSTKRIHEFLKQRSYTEMIPKDLLRSSSTISQSLASS